MTFLVATIKPVLQSSATREQVVLKHDMHHMHRTMAENQWHILLATIESVQCCWMTVSCVLKHSSTSKHWTYLSTMNGDMSCELELELEDKIYPILAMVKTEMVSTVKVPNTKPYLDDVPFDSIKLSLTLRRSDLFGFLKVDCDSLSPSTSGWKPLCRGARFSTFRPTNRSLQTGG